MRIRAGKKGQGLVEYSVILILVAIACLVIVTALGSGLGSVYSNVVCNLKNQSCVPASPSSSPTADLTGTWTATGDMTAARVDQTSTVLANGKVLVAGGYDLNYSGPIASAELYDPTLGTWSATGSMTVERTYQTATLFTSGPLAGKVLVAGGDGIIAFPNSALASAELYDPGTGTWSATGSMSVARGSHNATLLPNGKVLVTGGQGTGNAYLASAELYDPSTQTWSTTTSMSVPRAFHTDTLFAAGPLAGKVLAAGGQTTGFAYLASAELYDPSAGTWSATGSMVAGRAGHTATLLLNGKVLAAAGSTTGGATVGTADLYDPSTGTWSVTGSMATARYVQIAVLLPSGLVLTSGGYDTSYLTSAELYDPGTGTWSVTGNMTLDHAEFSAVYLGGNEVLVEGGDTVVGSGVSARAEIYHG